MKKILNANNQQVVNTFNDLTLWSAPFGRLLLENIPMKSGATVVDIGFGTGFPLIELSQRFGATSTIYGIDIWEEAVCFVREKIKILELDNIILLEKSASEIDISDSQVDLVTSNLGINNFGDKAKVYQSIKRILKPNGRLCITTNPIGTFSELFELFKVIFKENNWQKELELLETDTQRRNTETGIVAEIEANGFELVKVKRDKTYFRFVDAEALMNHNLIRIGFREGWEKMVRTEYQAAFFEVLFFKIKNVIETQGEFKVTVPILYLEFKK